MHRRITTGPVIRTATRFGWRERVTGATIRVREGQSPATPIGYRRSAGLIPTPPVVPLRSPRYFIR